eukprot:995620-Amorphochlora_amoeboformis.AAC.1
MFVFIYLDPTSPALSPFRAHSSAHSIKNASSALHVKNKSEIKHGKRIPGDVINLVTVRKVGCDRGDGGAYLTQQARSHDGHPA